MLSTVAFLLGSKVGRWFLVFGAAALSVTLLCLRAFSNGRQFEKNKATAQRIKELSNVARADAEISALGRDDRFERVSQWLRDD